MAKKLIIPAGTRFGKLTVIREGERRVKPSGQKFRNFRCLCDCGNEVEIQLFCLTSGESKSCGCLRREKSTRHGMSKTGTYQSWHHMLQRCYNTKNDQFKDYGERGITVCEEWKVFENFYADMGERPASTSIDRIDNSKGYYKENCKWSTKTEQQNNRRANRFINYKGEIKTVAQWARHLGVNYEMLSTRINKGMKPELAFTLKKYYYDRTRNHRKGLPTL